MGLKGRNASPISIGDVHSEPITDDLVSTALDGLASSRKWFGPTAGPGPGVAAALRSTVEHLVSPTATEPEFLDSRVVWTVVVGGLGAIALRAASAATAEDERAALIMLLETVADTALATPDGRWREVTFNRAGPLGEVRLGTTVPTGTGHATVVDATSWNTDEPQLRLLEYAPHGGFGAIDGGVVVSTRESVGWGGRDRLVEFLGLLRDRGPAGWRPDGVQALTEATGMPRALAGLLLAGLPKAGWIDGRVVPKQARQTLGLKVSEVDAVLRTIQSIDTDLRLLLCDRAMPSDPADLWDHGPDVAALAALWNRRFGRRVSVPEAVVADLAATLTAANAGAFARRPADVALGLADPDTCPWLTLDRHLSIRDGRLEVAGEPEGFGPDALLAGTTALLRLAYSLAPGDPLRAGLPRVYHHLRQRLDNPDLIVRIQEGHPTAAVREQYGLPRPRKKKAAPQGVTTFPLGPAGFLVAQDDWPDQIFVRPALLTPGDPLLEAGPEDEPSQALSLLLDPEVAGLVAAIEVTSIEAGGSGWAQDPLVSVPELVPLVAAALGLDEAAARLYLQLLALPDPTDPNVMRWNGWTRRQLLPAGAALVKAGLVVEGKRRRAGRSVFLPGEWLDAAEPIEAWKVPLLGLFPLGHGRLGLCVPTVGVGELFRRAWARVTAGEGPEPVAQTPKKSMSTGASTSGSTS